MEESPFEEIPGPEAAALPDKASDLYKTLRNVSDILKDYGEEENVVRTRSR